MNTITRILVFLLAGFFLAACTNRFTPKPNGNRDGFSSTPTILATPPPTSTSADITETVAVEWTPLAKDDLGDWNYDCQVTAVNFEVIEILPGVDATGFLVCGGYNIPTGIMDRNTNILYYWGLFPIQNPTILDHLGERGVERFLTTFSLGETYLDAEVIIGKNLSMTINLPNVTNQSIFDTQNIGKFAGVYWQNQENVDLFAQTGSLSNPDYILYPISLGIQNN